MRRLAGNDDVDHYRAAIRPLCERSVGRRVKQRREGQPTVGSYVNRPVRCCETLKTRAVAQGVNLAASEAFATVARLRHVGAIESLSSGTNATKINPSGGERCRLGERSIERISASRRWPGRSRAFVVGWVDEGKAQLRSAPSTTTSKAQSEKVKVTADLGAAHDGRQPAPTSFWRAVLSMT